MPQRQLPIFPAGVTEINHSIAVQKQDGQVWYVHGHLPVFHHEEEDVGSFRMFTSQMIVNGTVKPKEIVKAFGVPSITVKRYVKVFRERHLSIKLCLEDKSCGPFESRLEHRIELWKDREDTLVGGSPFTVLQR